MALESPFANALGIQTRSAAGRPIGSGGRRTSIKRGSRWEGYGATSVREAGREGNPLAGSPPGRWSQRVHRPSHPPAEDDSIEPDDLARIERNIRSSVEASAVEGRAADCCWRLNFSSSPIWDNRLSARLPLTKGISSIFMQLSLKQGKPKSLLRNGQRTRCRPGEMSYHLCAFFSGARGMLSERSVHRLCLGPVYRCERAAAQTVNRFNCELSHTATRANSIV